MPALLKVPKGFVTNFPNAVPDFVGPRQFILLLSFVGIFLLILMFILSDYSSLKTVSQNILSPQVRQINTIIAEIENPPEVFLGIFPSLCLLKVGEPRVSRNLKEKNLID